MNTHIGYSDIPKEERKQLAAEVYRLNPKLRAVRFAALLAPILFSGLFTDSVLPKDTSPLLHWVVRLVFALALCAIIWESSGRLQLKAETEKLKRPNQSTTAQRASRVADR
jgi:hypothetical protein